MLRNQLSFRESIADPSRAWERPLDLVAIWKRIQRQGDIFVELAIHILTIIANTAATERNFSQFGIIHSKLRNRLKVAKIHKTAMVKAELRREHEGAGLVASRKKRKLGLDDEPSDEAVSELPAPEVDENDDSSDHLDFDMIAQSLIDSAAAEDTQSDETEIDEITDVDGASLPSPGLPLPASSNAIHSTAPPSSHRRRAPVPIRTQIKLVDLFDYSDDAVAAGLGFYWQGGLQGLARAGEELERDYEAAFTIPTAAAPPAQTYIHKGYILYHYCIYLL